MNKIKRETLLSDFEENDRLKKEYEDFYKDWELAVKEGKINFNSTKPLFEKAMKSLWKWKEHLSKHRDTLLLKEKD